ncbi:hypothetical protein BgiMline_020185 [Biomphalaria glabrata]|nr:hypothetical protein BgiMline_017404 [Biomphalaria glabrata]
MYFAKHILLTVALIHSGLSLRLDSNTKKIETGQTKSLLINCSVLKGGNSKLSGLVSLILSYQSNVERNEFIPLASINSIDGNMHMHTSKAQGHGVINNTGDSYLSLQWPYPTDEMAGEYKCEAHGVDQFFRPTAEVELIKINASVLSLESLRDELRSVLMFVDQQRLQNQEFEILKSRIDSSKLWFFKRSDVYKGRRYYLSQQDPISQSEQSMATCALYGGYLAEIEDWDELTFVKAFIRKLSGFKLVLIGGTDEAQEEIWRYRTNNSLVPDYMVKSRKFGRECNCLYMFDGVDWMAVDDRCYYTNSDYPTRFLCEIPEEE